MNRTSDVSQKVQQANNSLINSGVHKTGTDKMGKDDFMHLLLTQMTHQDPMSPMDSKAMMEQFAQMGSMEQLTNLNAKIDKLNTIQGDMAQANLLGYLDKDITVRGGQIRMVEGKSQPITFKTTDNADVQVFITDEDGNQIRSLKLGPKAAGSHVIAWDSRDDKGDRVLDATYRYSVVAKGKNGETVPAELFMTGKVSGVRLDNGRALLKLGNTEVEARDVVNMSNASETLFGPSHPKPLHNELTPKPPIMGIHGVGQ